jgi:hypothetical protein
MGFLWGKTRCTEVAGWEDRMISKLVIAGAQQHHSGCRRQGSGTPNNNSPPVACAGLQVAQVLWLVVC